MAAILKAVISLYLAGASRYDEESQLMTPEERFQRIESAISGLATAAERHAAAVEKHDEQIEALLTIADKHAVELTALRAVVTDVNRQWQAYINTLPRR